MAEIWFQGLNKRSEFKASDERATVQRTSGTISTTGGVRLELTSPDGVWMVELTRREVGRILELMF